MPWFLTVKNVLKFSKPQSHFYVNKKAFYVDTYVSAYSSFMKAKAECNKHYKQYSP